MRVIGYQPSDIRLLTYPPLR
ncbi:hypothetical protein MPLA_570045 [Mesorhizobium sp. ORS 3359]|nr:hypothetical protein MPLA_570045 [Mesorhizobium sp. ORS 3359]